MVVHVEHTPFVWLCGALHHTLVHVDLNYPFPDSARPNLAALRTDLPLDVNEYQFVDAQSGSEGNSTVSGIEYVPTNNRQLWTNKKYIGSDCKSILNLPPGLHVISLSTNSSHPNHLTTLTHVITWQ